MSLLRDTDLPTHRSMFSTKAEEFIVGTQMNAEICLTAPIRSHPSESS